MTKLYHFGLNLKIGMELIPDYHKKSKLVIPYIEALNKSEEAFEVMLLQGRYLREVMRRSGLREWSNYCKWATEAVFEYVRQNRFKDRYSRIKTNYFYAEVEQCKELYKKDYIDSGDDNGEELFEVSVEDEGVQYFDMEIYNSAYKAMENQKNIAEIIKQAEKYWLFEKRSSANLEVLSDKKAILTKKLDWNF